MRPVPLTPAPGDDKRLLNWCKEKIEQICRASQVDNPVAKDKQNAGKFLAKSANLSDVADAATAFGNIKQTGTEEATGALELATSAETVTGSDDTRATHPAGVTAAIDAAVTALKDGVDSAFDTLKKLAEGLATKLTAADNLSDVDDAATAFDNIKQAATTTETGVLITLQKAFGSWLITDPEDKDYPVIVGAGMALTITTVTTKTSAGTATVTVKINGTPLGGSANSASTTKSTESHSSDNVVSVGDDVTITVSNTSGAEDLSITIAGTTELATA